MFGKLTRVALLSVCFAACSAQASDHQNLLQSNGGMLASANLGFEDYVQAGALPWSWQHAGNQGYDVVTDGSVVHSGRASGLIAARAGHGEFGAFAQCTPVAAAQRGRRLLYSGFLKTEGVANGFGGLWLRLDGADGSVLAFDNMANRGVSGTTDWTRYDIVLEVPAGAVQACYGSLLVGDGALWTDDLTFDYPASAVAR